MMITCLQTISIQVYTEQVMHLKCLDCWSCCKPLLRRNSTPVTLLCFPDFIVRKNVKTNFEIMFVVESRF